jgi:hypothetical protein
VLFIGALSAANASILISGGPFGTLTDAEVSAPAGGSQLSQYSETFDVTVTGVPYGDEGAIYFAVDETARPFFGAPGFEYMNSWSGLTVSYSYPLFPGGTGTMSLDTPAFLPNGSTPISCYGWVTGQCAVNVIFGASQQMTFAAFSSVQYGFTPTPLQPAPSLSGNIEASVRIEPILWVKDLDTGALIDNAGVTFAPASDPPDPTGTSNELVTPEPGTAALVVVGALLVAIARMRRAH